MSLEWVHCNVCFAQPRPNGTSFFLSSCGHIVCGGCKDGVRAPQSCPECKKPSGVNWVRLTAKLPPEVAQYFTDPRVLANRLKQMIDFQSMHRDTLFRGMRHKYLVSRCIELEEELAQLTARLQQLDAMIEQRRRATPAPSSEVSSPMSVSPAHVTHQRRPTPPFHRPPSHTPPTNEWGYSPRHAQFPSNPGVQHASFPHTVTPPSQIRLPSSAQRPPYLHPAHPSPLVRRPSPRSQYMSQQQMLTQAHNQNPSNFSYLPRRSSPHAPQRVPSPSAIVTGRRTSPLTGQYHSPLIVYSGPSPHPTTPSTHISPQRLQGNYQPPSHKLQNVYLESYPAGTRISPRDMMNTRQPSARNPSPHTIGPNLTTPTRSPQAHVPSFHPCLLPPPSPVHAKGSVSTAHQSTKLGAMLQTRCSNSSQTRPNHPSANQALRYPITLATPQNKSTYRTPLSVTK